MTGFYQNYGGNDNNPAIPDFSLQKRLKLLRFREEIEKTRCVKAADLIREIRRVIAAGVMVCIRPGKKGLQEAAGYGGPGGGWASIFLNFYKGDVIRGMVSISGEALGEGRRCPLTGGPHIPHRTGRGAVLFSRVLVPKPPGGALRQTIGRV